MPVKIRLQRRGKKGQPFYHVVIADGRAPRDGRFIEKIGTYNPLTHPATIVLNFDRAYHWINCGAQPTDTVRMILRREGIYLKQHLMGGVQKGALTEEQAEEKLTAWKEEKAHKLSDMKLEIINSQKSIMKKRIEAETKVKEAKADSINEKRQAVLAAEAAKKAEAEAKAQAEAEEKAQAKAKAKAETQTATETQENIAEITSETIEQTPEVTEETPAKE
ncbi:MAG: 30S ribosomal protein S16 [Bacteroidales bacterium]|jgi:small subunit ribosomal protein S16|nr:30S ribosomal protein S16 [Bacteroidales bacterium]